MKLNNKECALFLKELSNVLNAGVSAFEGLSIIAEDHENKDFAKALDEAKNKIMMGDRLSNALKETEYFDDYLIAMIDIGENTGYLDKSLHELSKYYERLDNSSNKLKSAIYYPSIILLVMIAVMVVIVVKVLPVFEEVLSNMGSGLNTTSSLLMSVGKWLANYGLIFIVVFVLFVVVYVLSIRIKYKDDYMKMLLLHNPITGKLAKDSDVSGFVFGLSLLVNSGYDEKSSLEMLRKLVSSKDIKAKLEEVESKVDLGASLADALAETKLLKNKYERMLKIGYKSGKFEKCVSDIADEYEKEVDTSVNKFLNMIEPSIIIVCSLIVGIILLSVMLPLLSIMSSI